MSAESLPDRLYPAPPDGWTADDLDRLPPSAPRIELIGGALIMVSPQASFHSRVTRRLANAHGARGPSRPVDRGGETIRLGERQRPEPDILVVDAPPKRSAPRTCPRGSSSSSRSSRPSRSPSVVVPFPMEIDLTTP